ncbi:MAG: DUF4070 domain-containing protein [Proteobacteria bacterium]|nr:DUF4070 domain-containing protein [Pseudomonadota bacterium]
MLFERLQQEGRILGETRGDNTDFSINFIPKMGYQRLVEGYRYIVTHIYSPRHFHRCLITSLRDYHLPKKRGLPIQFCHMKAFFHSLWALGIRGKERFHYWKTLLWTLFRRPRLFPSCVSLSIYGYHFRRVFEGYLQGTGREVELGSS